jgi:hypothetical protein
MSLGLNAETEIQIFNGTILCLCPAQLQCIAPGPHDIAVVKFFPKIWVVKRAASQPSIDRKPKFPIGILTDDVGNVLF